MNTDTGDLYKFDTKEALAAAQEKKNQKLVEITKKMYEDLAPFPAEQRPHWHRQLTSKNNQARRRARRKLAKASRQRNRK